MPLPGFQHELSWFAAGALVWLRLGPTWQVCFHLLKRPLRLPLK